MQDVGENMDQLFRNAAENYMLKEGDSNWNEIFSQLQTSSPVVPGKQNQKRKYIITGFLLFICFMAGSILIYHASRNSVPVVAKTKTKTTDKSGKSIFSGKTESQKDSDAFEEENKSVTKNLSKNFKPYLVGNGNSYTLVSPGTTNLSTTHITKTETTNNPASLQQIKTALKNEQIPPSIIRLYSLQKDSTRHISPVRINTKKKHGIYYGLLAGTGFTTVRSQDFSKPGFDLGVIAGYHFTPKLSAEISLLYSNRFYYSDGKYFKMDKMVDSMPSDMKVMSLIGNSKIFEIPVKFKYDFVQTKSSSVYVATGISSYVLINEKNDYVISMNGTAGTMNGTYKKTTGYFAGAINISAGYEHSVGKSNTIRFEPYITIPTKGIGIGSLPVTTSGIHILFTRSTRK